VLLIKDSRHGTQATPDTLTNNEHYYIATHVKLSVTQSCSPVPKSIFIQTILKLKLLKLVPQMTTQTRTFAENNLLVQYMIYY